MNKRPQKTTVVRTYTEQHIDEICDAIKAKYLRGECTGILFALREGDFDHGIGLAGDYREDPLLAKQVTGALFDLCSELAKPQRVDGGKL